MATAIVSGRVEEEIRQRANAFIEKQGLTAADVIKIVWNNIAITGKVPLSLEQGSVQPKRTELFEEFHSFVEDLPECSDEIAALDKQQLREMLVGKYV